MLGRAEMRGRGLENARYGVPGLKVFHTAHSDIVMDGVNLTLCARTEAREMVLTCVKALPVAAAKDKIL